MPFPRLILPCLAAVLALVIFPALATAAGDDPMAGLNTGDNSNGPAPLIGLASDFSSHLVVLTNNGEFKPADATTLSGVKFLAFYYSASWCAPCRAFTPKLVDFYKQFKATHPNFELIFVNRDQTEDAMLAYMKIDDMTWPAVRFDDIAPTQATRFCGKGIPDLVLTDIDGRVLSDSFNGDTYLGPYRVMDDIKTMVPNP